MKKVSLIIPSFEVGGTESSFIRKANYLKRTEFVPEMVYWTEGGELRKNLDSSINIVKLNASSLRQLFFQFINASQLFIDKFYLIYFLAIIISTPIPFLHILLFQNHISFYIPTH